MSIHETSLRNIAHAQIERLEGQLHAMKDALGLLLSHAISTSGDRTFDMIDAFQASVDASSLEFDNARSLDAALHMADGIVEEARYWQDFERKCAANLI
ncbi:hypothetical protein EWH08_19715 [Sphingobium indicum]|uniref:Uncharacterized protein n=1 Tax=Sphingobium indicum TaxID=332055 RepID=A0A4Q4IT22_9SPHN|nr:hypothetical protein [Sphingobium indicum]NYI25016.1 hypothetical protein [Sphingobium indicum]RYL96474.1 hypothetical protein EWH08_19715 [Sphingobium indicum]